MVIKSPQTEVYGLCKGGCSYSSTACSISAFLGQQIAPPLLSTLKNTWTITEDKARLANLKVYGLCMEKTDTAVVRLVQPADILLISLADLLFFSLNDCNVSFQIGAPERRLNGLKNPVRL
jgi:hypothetical protein